MNLLIPLLGVMFDLHRLTAGQHTNFLPNETMRRVPAKQSFSLPLSHSSSLSLIRHNYTKLQLNQNEKHINQLNNSYNVTSYNTINTSVNNNNTSIRILTLPQMTSNNKNNISLAKVMPNNTDSNLMVKDENWQRKTGEKYSLVNKDSDYSIKTSSTNSTEKNTKNNTKNIMNNNTENIRNTWSDKGIKENSNKSIKHDPYNRIKNTPNNSNNKNSNDSTNKNPNSSINKITKNRINKYPNNSINKSPNNSINKSPNNSSNKSPNNSIISTLSTKDLSSLPHQISPNTVMAKQTTTEAVISSSQTPRGSHQRSGHGQLPNSQLTALKSSEILRRYNLSVQAGELVFLSCEVPHFLDQNVQVSWVRRNDWHILSSGLQLYTRERRFEIHHDEENDEWILLLRYANVNDSGTYDCQMVDSTKSLSHLVDLTVTSATATIIGDGEYHVDEGSTISLVCHINYTNSAPNYVFWYHNNRMISFDRQRGGINVTIEVTSHVTSHLRISKANQKDSGNYTCMATNTEPDSITVYITDLIEGAAVQGRGSSTSVVQRTKCKPLIIWTIFTLLLWKI